MASLTSNGVGPLLLTSLPSTPSPPQAINNNPPPSLLPPPVMEELQSPPPRRDGDAPRPWGTPLVQNTTRRCSMSWWPSALARAGRKDACRSFATTHRFSTLLRAWKRFTLGMGGICGIDLAMLHIKIASRPPRRSTRSPGPLLRSRCRNWRMRSSIRRPRHTYAGPQTRSRGKTPCGSVRSMTSASRIFAGYSAITASSSQKTSTTGTTGPRRTGFDPSRTSAVAVPPALIGAHPHDPVPIL